MVSFSYSGSGNPFKRMRKHFMATWRVLWRRWRLPLPLAALPTALVTWLGVRAAPHVEPFNDGWRSITFGCVLMACLIFSWYLVDRWRSVKQWAHGPFPPPDGAEKGWFLRESVRRRSIGLLLVAPLLALVQFWAQAAHDGGRTVDASAGLSAFFVWASLIRGLVPAAEPAIAVTASGVFNGAEFYRWEEIMDLRPMGDEDDLVLTLHDGRRRYLELPQTRLKSTEVYTVVNYFLVRPGARAGIPGAVRPPIVTGLGSPAGVSP